MTPPISTGLIGFGLAGRVFHAPLIAATAGLELTCVLSTRGEEIAHRYPEVAVVGDAEALWERCRLVVVAAPNRFHAELAEAALERGLAVVVDKPLATSAAAAERLAAAAAGRLTVFHNRRFDGDFLTVRRLIANGELGPVHRFESRFERFRPELRGGWREAADPAAGGGLLLDLGPHLIDQALLLFGPARTVYAELDRRRPGAAVEDDVFISLGHASGVRSHLWLSALAPLAGERFAVSGGQAGFTCRGLDPQEGQLRDGLAPGAADFGHATRPGLLAGRDGTVEIALERGAYPRFYEAVVTWLGAGGPPPVPPEQAIEVMAVIDAAATAAAERTVVTMSDGATAFGHPE